MNVLDAAHAVGHDYPGGAHALGPRLGMTGRMLANKLNPNDEAHKLMLVEALRMQQLTGDHRILQAEAEELGYALLKLPSVDAGDFASEAMRTVKEFGDFIGSIEESMRDGKVTPNELRRIERELLEALAHISALHKLIASRVGRR